jgi:hypothetical protein
MLSVSDVWKMMNEKRPKIDRTTVAMRLEKARIESFIRTTLSTINPKEIHIETTPLSKYTPPLRSHEYWRLTREDQQIIEAAMELGLIPDINDDCRDDLIAAYAITDEQWEAAKETHEQSFSKDEFITEYADMDEEWEAGSENWGI